MPGGRGRRWGQGSEGKAGQREGVAGAQGSAPCEPTRRAGRRRGGTAGRLHGAADAWRRAASGGCTLLMWTPMPRCTPAQRMQMKTPQLMDAQVGRDPAPAPPQSAQARLAGSSSRRRRAAR